MHNPVDWKEFMEKLYEKYGNMPEHLPRHSDLSLLVAIILSARTRDSNVIKFCDGFLKDCAQISRIENLTREEIAVKIKSINFSRRKSNTIYELISMVKQSGEKSIYNKEALMSIEGIGEKTANVFLNITTDGIYVGVDTHVHKTVEKMSGRKFKNQKEVEKYCLENIPKNMLKILNKVFVYYGKDQMKSKSKQNVNTTQGEQEG